MSSRHRFSRYPGRTLALAAALLTGLSLAHADSQLGNLSNRGQVGTGADVMVAGFAISGGSKQVLIRGVGPGLVPFGVAGTVADPAVTLFDADGAQLAYNDNWTSDQATIFAQVGAFDLQTGSKDAALSLTLPPGSYTAHVAGVAGGTGVALMEVYEVDGSAGGSRLLNLSARAVVGTGDALMIPGLVITGGGSARRVLVRAVGPTLADFGVSGVLADPYVSLHDGSGATLYANNNWGSGDQPSITAVAGYAGAFPLPDTASADAVVLAEINPGAYTVQVSGVGGTSGIALVEVYDVTPTGTPAVLSIAATDATADESGADTATFTVTRTGGDTTQPVIARYSVSGTAFNGLDYVLLNGVATIPAGQTSSTITIAPVPDISDEPVEQVTVTLVGGLGYTLGGSFAATADITSTPPTLYLASLRTDTGAASSTGYGTATILLSASGTIASVNVSLSNLSSAQTTSYLRLGAPGETGAYILSLPTGQVSGAVWQIVATGTYSVADIVDALQNGLIYLGVETVNYPTGELRGHFIESAGSQTFSPPASPPPAPTAPTSAAEAARFLTQATFGPATVAIDALMQTTYSQWIDAQMALPASSHRTATMADWAAFPTGGVNNNTLPGRVHRQSAWWQIIVNGQDQLRQRVAFALSEILVVSDENGTINNRQEGAANYYDLLANHAFGNYRELLEAVSLSPIMGTYLSHLRNAKANAITGALPDENYAREVMQLFSIGLVELQPDGTLKLNSSGLPIATYNQTTITEMAKVFTGWAFYNPVINDTTFRRGAADYITPMSLYPTQHEDGAKTIVGGVTLPAGQGGQKDLEDAMDALFNHPNTGPFIARRLIQRLVASNPSPGYVYRVAQVFADNGSGVRGDLGAVVRAILLDYEARSEEVKGNAGFGKTKEPLLRYTALLRAFNATDSDGRFNFTNPQINLAQAALRSPTVFNFFEPDYVQPGSLAAAGLYAPEFQILTDTTAITVPNQLYSQIFQSPSGISINTSSLTSLAGTPGPLVDAIALTLASGALSPDAQARIVEALNALPASTSTTDRLRTAIYLVINSPDAATQR